jgi:hypothetical protein
LPRRFSGLSEKALSQIKAIEDEKLAAYVSPEVKVYLVQLVTVYQSVEIMTWNTSVT